MLGGHIAFVLSANSLVLKKVATGQGNLVFLQGQGKVGEFRNLVGAVLNTKF